MVVYEDYELCKNEFNIVAFDPEDLLRTAWCTCADHMDFLSVQSTLLAHRGGREMIGGRSVSWWDRMRTHVVYYGNSRA